MNNDQNFTPDESLQLIRSMIEKTKQGMYDNSIYFLLWGWGAFLACIVQYILKVLLHSPYHYHVWWIAFVCLAITFIIGSRKLYHTGALVKNALSKGKKFIITGSR